MITETDKLKCVERELRLRKRVYANRLETGRMTQKQVAHELACMEAIVADYQQRAKIEELPLHRIEEWLGYAPQTR